MLNDFSRPSLLENAQLLSLVLRKGPVTAITDRTSLSRIFKCPDQTVGFGQPFNKDPYWVLTANPGIVQELLDEQRFDKYVLPSFRDFLGDFLVTAWTNEKSWPISNRIISSTLAGQHLRDQFASIADSATLLCERIRSESLTQASIQIADLIGRTTFDIGEKVIYGKSSGALLSEDPPRLLQAISGATRTIVTTAHEPIFLQKLRIMRRKGLAEKVQALKSHVRTQISIRQGQPARGGKKELLSMMMTGVDPVTGERMSSPTLENQSIGLTGAFYEAVRASTLWMLYYLTAYPELAKQAYAEIDAAFPDSGESITYEKLQSLDFLPRVFKEAQRLTPVVPSLSYFSLTDTSLLGRYAVKKGTIVSIPLHALHNNPTYWDNPERFDPDRFLPENEARITPGSYVPFGIGSRSCIGKGFALVEVMTIVTQILRNFSISLDKEYTFQFDAHSLAGQPLGLKLNFQARAPEQGAERAAGETAVHAGQQSTTAFSGLPGTLRSGTCPFGASEPALKNAASHVLNIAYGSNGGYCKNLATRIAQYAGQLGFQANILELDDAAGKIDTRHPLLLLCSSYNGWAPMNAQRFINWLENGTGELSGLRYAVLGVGDRTWQSSFLAVPSVIDEALAASGGSRLSPMARIDVSLEESGADIDQWIRRFWSALGVAADTAPSQLGLLRVLKLPSTPLSRLHLDMVNCEVHENRELQRKHGADPAERSTRHIEFTLPDGVSFKPGDYVYVHAVNHRSQITKAMHAFGLESDEIVEIKSEQSGISWLPLDSPMPYSYLFAKFIDLKRQLGRRDFLELSKSLEGPSREAAWILGNSSDDAYKGLLRHRRLSLLDFLESQGFPKLSFEVALNFLAPLKERFYSISSSPALNPRKLSVTVGVLSGPHVSGQGSFSGLCSNYLASLNPGDFIRLGIMSSDFRLPADPSIPMIWIGAGTGISPYRSFMQERSIMLMNGVQLGPCMLIAGCRRSDHDQIYAEEWRAAEARGVLEAHWAYSRQLTDGALSRTYVQDVIARRRPELADLLDRGAHVYVCGDAETIGKSVKTAFGENTVEALRKAGRWREDVWGGNRV